MSRGHGYPSSGRSVHDLPPPRRREERVMLTDEERIGQLVNVLRQHVPDNYDYHGCRLACGWSEEDETTSDDAAEHLARALVPTVEAIVAERVAEAVAAVVRDVAVAAATAHGSVEILRAVQAALARHTAATADPSPSPSGEAARGSEGRSGAVHDESCHWVCHCHRENA